MWYSGHLLAISITLILYVFLAVVYFGWGKAAGSLLGLKKQENLSVFLAIWMGWSFTLLILQFIHFFFPLTVFVVMPVFMTGIVLFIPQIIKVFRNGVPQPSMRTLIILFCVVVVVLAISSWVASRSMLPPTNSDTALYHLNAIRWINSFKLVPGLGNLHGRLAFNQSFFPYVAALNFYPYFGHGRSIANSFLFILTIATYIDFLRPVFKSPSLLFESHPFQYFLPFLVMPMFGYLAISSNGLSSPTPDLTSTLLQLVMFVVLTRGLADWINGKAPRCFMWVMV